MRRMIDPQTIIKSQIVDDKHEVDLNEIVEKYGTVINAGKTITLQIYNKQVTDESQNSILSDDDNYLAQVVVNGSITLTKYSDGTVYIQGMLIDEKFVFKHYVEIESGSYENGIILSTVYEFDIHVIKV